MREPLGPGDVWRTPERPSAAWRRLLPSLGFYAPTLRIVFRSSWLAARGRYGDAEWVEASRGIQEAMEATGARCEVSGLDTLRNLDGPAVIVGNHMSTLETFLLPGMVRPFRPVTFVVKQSLVKVPVFGPVMRSRDPVVVGRRDARSDFQAILQGGKAHLDKGMSIIVFPQTTRTPVFQTRQFNSIGVKLARAAKVPVIPLALRTDAWPLGKPWKDLARIRPERPIRFAFGPAMTLEGAGKAEQTRVVAFIADHLREWGAPVEDGR